MIDQLRAIRTFHKVVDAGGFAAAARALDQSPAVITRQVAELEAHLGTRLLNRSTRHIAITQAGLAYAESTRQLLAGLQEADAAAQVATTRPQGHLRVLVPPAFAVHQLVPALPRFRAQYPEVTLELLAAGPVHGVDDGADLSVIVVSGDALDGDFIARPLARSRWLLCAAPDYLQRSGRPQQPADLRALDHLLPPVPEARHGVTFLAGAAAGDAAHDSSAPASVTLRPPAPVLASLQLDTLLAAAVAGMGVVALPSFMAAAAVQDGRLEQVLAGWQVAKSLSLFVGLPSRRHLPARTRAFTDFLLQAFGGQPEGDPWLVALSSATRPPALAQ